MAVSNRGTARQSPPRRFDDEAEVEGPPALNRLQATRFAAEQNRERMRIIHLEETDREEMVQEHILPVLNALVERNSSTRLRRANRQSAMEIQAANAILDHTKTTSQKEQKEQISLGIHRLANREMMKRSDVSRNEAREHEVLSQSFTSATRHLQQRIKKQEEAQKRELERQHMLMLQAASNGRRGSSASIPSSVLTTHNSAWSGMGGGMGGSFGGSQGGRSQGGSPASSPLPQDGPYHNENGRGSFVYPQHQAPPHYADPNQYAFPPPQMWAMHPQHQPQEQQEQKPPPSSPPNLDLDQSPTIILTQGKDDGPEHMPSPNIPQPTPVRPSARSTSNDQEVATPGQNASVAESGVASRSPPAVDEQQKLGDVKEAAHNSPKAPSSPTQDPEVEELPVAVSTEKHPAGQSEEEKEVAPTRSEAVFPEEAASSRPTTLFVRTTAPPEGRSTSEQPVLVPRESSASAGTIGAKEFMFFHYEATGFSSSSSEDDDDDDGEDGNIVPSSAAPAPTLGPRRSGGKERGQGVRSRSGTRSGGRPKLVLSPESDRKVRADDEELPVDEVEAQQAERRRELEKESIRRTMAAMAAEDPPSTASLLMEGDRLSEAITIGDEQGGPYGEYCQEEEDRMYVNESLEDHRQRMRAKYGPNHHRWGQRVASKKPLTIGQGPALHCACRRDRCLCCNPRLKAKTIADNLSPPIASPRRPPLGHGAHINPKRSKIGSGAGEYFYTPGSEMNHNQEDLEWLTSPARGTDSDSAGGSQHPPIAYGSQLPMFHPKTSIMSQLVDRGASVEDAEMLLEILHEQQHSAGSLSKGRTSTSPPPVLATPHQCRHDVAGGSSPAPAPGSSRYEDLIRRTSSVQANATFEESPSVSQFQQTTSVGSTPGKNGNRETTSTSSATGAQPGAGNKEPRWAQLWRQGQEHQNRRADRQRQSEINAEMELDAQLKKCTTPRRRIKMPTRAPEEDYFEPSTDGGGSYGRSASPFSYSDTTPSPRPNTVQDPFNLSSGLSRPGDQRPLQTTHSPVINRPGEGVTPRRSAGGVDSSPKAQVPRPQGGNGVKGSKASPWTVAEQSTAVAGERKTSASDRSTRTPGAPPTRRPGSRRPSDASSQGVGDRDAAPKKTIRTPTKTHFK